MSTSASVSRAEVVEIARTQWTIIARHLARRTTALVGDTTDSTDVAFVVWIGVAGVPAPLGDGAPVFDVDFHCDEEDACITIGDTDASTNVNMVST